MSITANRPEDASPRGHILSIGAGPVPLALMLLAAIIAVLSLTVAFRSAARMEQKPLIDDAYYSLAVAENIAHGHGVTIDGDQTTNGFQPLFTFATVPAFYFTDSKVAAVRVVTVMEWLLLLATAALLADIARRAWTAGDDERGGRTLFWIVFTLYAGATNVFLTHLNGLETGCLLFFYTLVWWTYQRGVATTMRGCVLFGTLLGLTVLTRIDAALLVVGACGLLLLAPGETSDRLTRLKRAAITGSTALIVSSPWWIYNVLEFGSLMPSSGTAEQDISLAPARFPFLVYAVFKDGAPWLSAGSRDHNIAVEAVRVVAVVVIAGLVWTQRQWLRDAFASLDRHPERRRSFEFAACILVTLCVLALWYLETSGASWFYNRYLAPLSLLTVLALAYAVWQIGRRIPLTPVAISGGATALMLVLGVAPQHVGHPYPWADQVALVREQVPEGDVVAAGQTGALGFFRVRVVNLDGKVNADALDYQDHMWDYLRQKNIRWFVDEPEYFYYLGADPAKAGWRIVGTNGTFTLFHYEGGAVAAAILLP